MVKPQQKVIIYSVGIRNGRDYAADRDRYNAKDENYAPCPRCGRLFKVKNNAKPQKHNHPRPNQAIPCV